MVDSLGWYIVKKSDDICHYGVLGMRWGVRRYQPYSVKPRWSGEKGVELIDIMKSSKRLKNAKVLNLDKWGADKKHNTLYITGYSGSGKSTAAEALTGKNDTIINLDLFLEKTYGGEPFAPHGKDVRVREYLKREYPKYLNLNKDNKDRLTKEWFNILDGTISAIDRFSEQEYGKGRKVVIEGVQLLDDTIYKGNDWAKDKPIIIMGTSPVVSSLSAAKRDGESAIKQLSHLSDTIKWYRIMNDDKVSLIRDIGAKRLRDVMNTGGRYL